MASETEAVPVSRTMLWSGRILSGLLSAMLMLDGIMKIVQPPSVVQATTQLGYPQNTILGIGVALLVSVILYMIPTTTVLGAILLTGYLGGAVATHVRAGQAPMGMFAVIFGVLVWLGVFLREPRLRKLVPLRS